MFLTTGTVVFQKVSPLLKHLPYHTHPANNFQQINHLFSRSGYPIREQGVASLES